MSKVQKMAHDNGMGALQALLQLQTRLVDRGFTFEIESPTVLVVSRGPHVRGIWRVENLAYSWIPSGYSEPSFVADSTEAAVRYAIATLANID